MKRFTAKIVPSAFSSVSRKGNELDVVLSGKSIGIRAYIRYNEKTHKEEIEVREARINEFGFPEEIGTIAFLKEN